MVGRTAARAIAGAYAALALLSLTLGFTILPYTWMDEGPRGFFPLELLRSLFFLLAGPLGFAAVPALPLLLALGAGAMALGAWRERPWAWNVTMGLLAFFAAWSLLWALMPSPTLPSGSFVQVRPGPTPLVRLADVVLAALCAWGAWALQRARRRDLKPA